MTTLTIQLRIVTPKRGNAKLCADISRSASEDALDCEVKMADDIYDAVRMVLPLVAKLNAPNSGKAVVKKEAAQ